jgi:CDGSH-type Zn-finger protein
MPPGYNQEGWNPDHCRVCPKMGFGFVPSFAFPRFTPPAPGDGVPKNSRATIPVMPTNVSILNNGPIRIEGDFEILDPTGAAFGLAGRTVISLCRCGQSANKPFCDGSHARTGFNNPVEARDLPPPKPKL